MSAKIKLSRVEKIVPVVRNGSVSLETRDEMVCVVFAGPDGREVSLAFDGRFDSYLYSNNSVNKDYVPYSDCPIIADGKQSGAVSDLQAMRFLRDALIALDLGDYDETRECAKCGVRFVPAYLDYYHVCEDCDG